MAGAFFGQRGTYLQDAPMGEAFFFVYAYTANTSEGQVAGRKAVEHFLTAPVSELLKDAETVDESTPMTELSQSMALDWDAFEKELGVTYQTADSQNSTENGTLLPVE